MRQHWATAARLFFPAYANAIGWVLAGCGWGVVIGAALEAVFGRGDGGLLDAAGETGLIAVAAAMAGMVGGALLWTSLHLVALIPFGVLLGRTIGRYPSWVTRPGILFERSARSGAIASVIFGVFHGVAFSPLWLAALLLESIQRKPLPCAFLHWCTLSGVLAGGIVGMLALGRQFYRGMPESWRVEVRESVAIHPLLKAWRGRASWQAILGLPGAFDRLQA
jgi:hypothetical protein